MRRWLLFVVAVAVCGAATTAEAQVNACRLLGKAEVRAAVGASVTAILPDVADGDLVAKCEFSVERGGVTVMVQDRQVLEGRSLAAWLDGIEPKLPFRAVPGLGEEAFLGWASAEAVEGKPETLTSTRSFVARQGSQVLTILVMVLGNGPSNEAVLKLARRALLRVTPAP